MKTLDEPIGMDLRMKAELLEVCDRLAAGVQTSREEKRDALARLNQMREEIRNRIGVQNIAVDLVRQSRDSR